MKLDLTAYKAKLDSYLEAELQRVAKIWLAGVTGRVPVWSGMARASLLFLAEMVGGRIAIAPVAGAPNRIPRGKAMGTAQRLGPYLIEVSTKVPHYVLQEYHNVGVSKSAPWLSFPNGAIAYRQAVKSVKLPRPDFVKVKL